MIPLRSMLYFPANSVRMAVKTATLPTDAAILDLEDAVSVNEKETARVLARDFVRLLVRRGIRTFVRVNSLTTGLTVEDINNTLVEGLDGFVLAKTETRSDVVQFSEMLTRTEKPSGAKSQTVKLIPLIESAKGLLNSFEIASASDRVLALAFGAGDYYRDLGRDISLISKQEDEVLYARSHIVNASRAAGVQAIDTPFLGSLTDKEGFTMEVRLAAQLGFKGKQCIHPSQIDLINRMFSPSSQDVDRAMRVAEAFERAQSRGLGVISVDGKMVDLMSYRQAKDLLATAETMQERGKIIASASSHVSISEVFSRS